MKRDRRTRETTSGFEMDGVEIDWRKKRRLLVMLNPHFVFVKLKKHGWGAKQATNSQWADLQMAFYAFAKEIFRCFENPAGSILIYDALVSYCWGLMGVKIFVWEENCGVRCYTGISSHGSYFFGWGDLLRLPPQLTHEAVKTRGDCLSHK